jgi:uncharacterized cupredoxin-like copper-binding protein
MSRWAALPIALIATLAVVDREWIAGAASSSAGSRHASKVVVIERDFRIRAARTIAAGHVDLIVANKGPDVHELIVVRDRGGPLPMHADGLTVDEDAVDPITAGKLEPGRPGGTRTLRLDLRPGRYIMFCNMSGHELGGMHTRLVVR